MFLSLMLAGCSGGDDAQGGDAAPDGQPAADGGKQQHRPGDPRQRRRVRGEHQAEQERQLAG